MNTNGMAANAGRIAKRTVRGRDEPPSSKLRQTSMPEYGRQPADRPLVSANFAITWDGRISTRQRTPADFSSPHDKQRLLEIRGLADAVFVSATTAGADHMTMGLPDAKMRAAREARGQAAYPLRVLLSNSGRIDPALPVFSQRFSPIIIYSTERMPKSTRHQLAGRAELRLQPEPSVDLAEMLRALRRVNDIRRAHCEGGGTLLRALLEHQLVDELYLTLCPRIFGSRTAATLTGPPAGFLSQSTGWKLLKMESIGDECYLHYRAR